MPSCLLQCFVIVHFCEQINDDDDDDFYIRAVTFRSNVKLHVVARHTHFHSRS